MTKRTSPYTRLKADNELLAKEVERLKARDATFEAERKKNTKEIERLRSDLMDAKNEAKLGRELCRERSAEIGSLTSANFEFAELLKGYEEEAFHAKSTCAIVLSMLSVGIRFEVANGKEDSLRYCLLDSVADHIRTDILRPLKEIKNG